MSREPSMPDDPCASDPAAGACCSAEEARLKERLARLEEELSLTRQMLEQETARVSRMFELAPVGYLDVSRDGVILRANRAIAALLGREVEALVGSPMADLVESADGAAWAEHHRQMIAQGTPQVADLRLRRADGSLLWAHLQSVLCVPAEQRCRLAVLNIGERREMEEQLRRQTSFLNVILEAIPNTVIVKEPHELRIVRVNRATERLLALPREEILGHTVRDRRPAEYADQYEASDRLALAERRMVEIPRDPMMTPSGEVRLLNTRKVPVLDDRGEPELLLIVSEDVTAHVRAEEARRISDERYRELFDSVFSVITILRSEDGVDFTIEDCNRSSLATIDLPREQVVGRNAAEVFPPFADIGLLDVFRKVWRTGEPEVIPELHFEGPDGPRWYSGRVFQLPSGEIVGLANDLTPARAAEQARRAADARYKRFVETSLEWIWEDDSDGIIVYVNPRMAEMLGYTPEEMVGRANTDFIRADERGHHAAMEARRRQGIPDVYQRTMVAKDGHDVPVRFSATPILSEEGAYKGSFGLATDLTEQRAAEQAIAEQQALLRTVIDNIPAAIYAKDAQGRKTLANRAEVEILGAESEAQVLGTTDADWYIPRLSARYEDVDAQVLNTGQPVLNRQASYLQADGTEVWLLTSKLPLRDARGNVAGLVGISQDISERVRAEQARRASEAQFERLVETAAEGVWQDDAEGTLVYANARMGEILGYAPGEMIGRINESLIWPADREGLRQHKERRRAGDYETYELRMLHRDGHPVWVRISAAPMQAPDGAFTGSFGMVTDITEERQAHEALARERHLLRTVIDTIPFPVYAKDAEGRKILANRADVAYMGTASEEEWLNRSDADVFAPERARSYLRLDRQVLETGQPALEVETYTELKDGSPDWRLTTKVPLKDAEGRVIGLVGIGMDITARKLAEEAQRRSDMRFQRLIEAAGEGIWQDDLAGTITYVNPRMGEILGYEPAEMIGRPLRDFVHPEEQAEHDRMAARRRQNKRDVYERRLVARDGRSILTRISAVPLQSSDGAIEGSLGLVTDITEARQAQDALANERLLLRTVIDSIPYAIYAKDREGRKILSNVNDAMHMGQITAEEALGKSDWEVYPPETAAEYAAEDEQVMAQGLPLLNKETIERTPDGDLSYVIHSKFPLRDTEGEIVGLVGIGQNITAIRRMEDALERERLLLRTVIDNVPFSVYAKDTEGRKILSNPVDASQMGCASTEEALGKTDYDVYPRALADEIAASDAAVLASGEPMVNQPRDITLLDGTNQHLLLSKIPLRDGAGQVIGLLGIGLNVTDIRTAERALAQERRLLRAIIDNIPFAICAKDIYGRKTLANPADVAIMGLEREEQALGKTDMELYPERYGNEYTRDDEVVLRTGQPLLDKERFFQPPGGPPRWRLGSKLPLRDSDERIVGLISISQDITERKRSEQALQQDEARLESLLRISQHPATSTPDFLEYALDEAVALTGSTLGFINRYDEDTHTVMTATWSRQVASQCDVENAPMDYHLASAGLWGEAIRQRRPIVINDYAAPNPLKRGLPEGHMGLQRFVVLPVFDHDRIVAVVCVANKQTDYGDADVRQLALMMDAVWQVALRRQTQERLAESEARFRSLVEAAPEGIFVHSGSRLLFANPAMVTLLGAESGADLVGTDLYDRIAPAYHGQVQARFRRGPEPGEASKAADLEMVRLDGSRVAVESNSVPIRFQGTDAFLCFARDVTERKQREAELAHSHELLRYIIEHDRSSVAVLDRQMRPIYVSQSFIREHGIHDAQVIGRSLYEAVPDIPAKWREAHRRSLAGEIVSAEEDEYTHVDGTADWTSWESRPWYEADGSIGGIIIYTEFVTSRVQRRLERDQLEAQLAQARKMESVGQLAGGVAHDFNNMLAVIMGYADIALESVGPEHPVHPDLLEIRQAAQRSADLTRQLLAFARKQIVSPQVLDLNEAVEGMLKMLRRLIGEDIDLAWLPGSQECIVRIDPSQLDQILANLCVNARDAIAGVGRVTIETDRVYCDSSYTARHGSVDPGHYVLLSVSDDGSGMDEDTQEHLFEPFFTTKGVGEGTGMGLATVYGVVRQNDGFINVYSEAGRGSTFKIYLPCQGDALRAQEESEAVLEPVGGRETILLVEDETAILRMTRSALEGRGYTVLSAATPQEALRLAEAHDGQIDLLITDVIMPQMNGRALAERLQPGRRGLRLLFMSGYTANVIATHGVLDEGVHFIQKPFSAREMAATVRRILDAPAR